LDKGKVLGILLSLLSLALVLVPIVAAFAAHGWDPKATLLGESNPLETRFENLQNLNTSDMFGTPTFESFSAQGVTATIRVKSPFDFPIKIKGFSGNLVCNDHDVVLSSVQLLGEVEFSAHATKNISVLGNITQAGIADGIVHGGIPPNTGIENVSLKLEIYGITLEGAFGSV
jgi:hypothetical protein